MSKAQGTAMLSIRPFATALALSLPLLGTCFTAPLHAQQWPTRPVKFIVPFGPGAGADIGGRLFAEKLTQKWGQPVIIENKPGGDSIVAIQAFLTANDDHVLLFGPSGNFTVHPFNYSKLPYNPADLFPVARASTTLIAATRAKPGTFNYGAVPGITEFIFWGYLHDQKLQMTQVPYRDINVAPVD